MPPPLGQRHARVTVMGLGLFGGGVGAARFWAGLGSRVTVTDLKDETALAPSLAALEGLGCRFVLGEHREEDFTETDLVVVNPAVRPDNRFIMLARGRGVPVTTEIGTLFQLLRGPIFGVTGSNGKSTTTALLGRMLQCADGRTLVGGNLGGSLLAAVRDHTPGAPAVLELSSFQLHYLGEQKASPDVAVITNLSPNHLDWHPSLEHYYESKRNILRHQWPEGGAVLNAADPVLRGWAEECRCRVLLFGLEDPGTPHAAFVRDKSAWARLAGAETELFPLSALRLPGRHNVENALAAAGAAFLHLRAERPIARGVASFEGLPHRLETVARIDGIAYVNDSIATTPESTLAALESFDRPVVLIAGGYDKKTDFDALGRAVAAKAKGVALIGATAEKIETAIAAAGGHLPVHRAGTLSEAVEWARAFVPPGGVVLLSPACASYDMFANFQERGEVFRRIVRGLSERL